MRIEEIRTTVNGHELLFRSPREEDAETLLRYLRAVNGETPYLARDAEDVTMTVEQEKSFIQAMAGSDSDMMLMVFCDGEHAGNGSLSGMGLPRCRHRAELALALYKKFSGMGIGTKSMEVLIELAKKHGWEQLELEVVTDNAPALALYRKTGFTVCGTLPFAMKYKDGTYAAMYRMLRRI